MQIWLAMASDQRIRHLLMPLTRIEGLAPRWVRSPLAPAAREVDALPAHLSPPLSLDLDLNLDLDAGPIGSLAHWGPAVARAAEPCLLIDSTGHVCALSPSAACLLAKTTSEAVGARLVALLSVVDFTTQARPATDLAANVPPLRSLSSNALARGLMRLRRADGGVSTYDVISAPLAGTAGAVCFLIEV